MKTIIFTLILLTAVSFQVVFAQDETDSDTDTTDYQIDEVIISATRTEQKLIDIPFSVQRVDQSQWKSTRKMGVNDVLSVIPGLWLQPRYGNHDVRVSIRGFGTRSNTGIRGVRILLDGIPESEPDGQTRLEALDFTSISKIEVIKGNMTSLYTNAPGGVINFFTDKYFPKPFVLSDNEFGSYDLRKNGLKFGLTSNDERFMATYSYENYGGYRYHSQEYQSRFNSIYEADLNPVSTISIYGYYVNGLIKLPGSLTLAQFDQNYLQANPRDVSRDSKRISNKGRLGITYNTKFGKNYNNFVEITGYGTIKDLSRTAATYRIFTRYGVGSNFRVINQSKIANQNNEFSVGGDFYYQTGPINEFNNIGGIKGDELQSLTDETISNIGLYFTEQYYLYKDYLSLLITGRYDRVIVSAADQLASYKDTSRVFDNFTPKFAINYKFNPMMSVFGSFGWGFDTPANNELDNFPFSSDGGYKLINPDLEAQNTVSYELGYKGEIINKKSNIFSSTFIELSLFDTKIDNAIVPFTVDGNVFFRNAATVKRTGLEFGVNSEVAKGFNVKLAYTYSNFRYGAYNARSIDAEGTITEADYSNNREPSNPDNNFSAELSYQYIYKKDYTFFAKGTIQSVGSMFVDDRNLEQYKTQSYTLLGSQIGVNMNFKNFRVMGFAGLGNILNEKYVAFVQINSDRLEYYEAGIPYNFFGGINLSYVFNQ
ncbi:MAG TPA: TonB-dependent receptor [Ignavibacteria bacterium]|nr:TonB-dependent receptor [Ignavibacteria bacterium]